MWTSRDSIAIGRLVLTRWRHGRHVFSEAKQMRMLLKPFWFGLFCFNETQPDLVAADCGLY